MSEGFWDYDRVTGEWGIRSPFNVNSSKQVLEYIKYRGHSVPRHAKTKEETTGKDEIAKLAKKYPRDPLYGQIVGRREVEKLLSTYVEGYEPHDDGRIHPKFTFNPSTGRLACEKPNVQNVSKSKGERDRDRWATELRRMFTAPPACIIAEFDYRGIEAVLVGWLAGDDEYIRAAKLGVHGIFASLILEHSGGGRRICVDDPDAPRLLKELAEANPQLYDTAKHIVHGSAYGGTAYKMHMTYSEDLPTIKKAAELQNLYFSTIGKKIRAWQKATLLEAHTIGYLNTVFGFRHYFNDVFHYDTYKRETVLGVDAKESLAFRPQSMARCVMTNALRRLDREDRERFAATIHDSLLFFLLEDTAKERCERIKETMEDPIQELGGLSIAVEYEIGRTWGDMK